MNKKYLMFGIPMLCLVLVSAGLLTYYGQIHQKVTVEQGLTIDGHSWSSWIIEDTLSTTSLENPVFMSVHYLDNNANVDANVDAITTCSPSGSTYSCDEINPKVYETNLRSGSLALSLKNTDWTQVTEDTDVIVTYSTDVATGLTTIDSITDLPIDYTLVYYADDEFDSDGVRLATPGQAYALSVGGVIPISTSDGNLKDSADYCAYDGYAHCRGIKLWAVRDADLSVNTITWNTGWQSAYYFETDMLGWNHLTGELDNPVEVIANSELDFVIVSEFQIGTVPATYFITTEVSPVTA